MTMYYVSVCPETNRVFLCCEGLDHNLAECFDHNGQTANQVAERLADALNRFDQDQVNKEYSQGRVVDEPDDHEEFDWPCLR